MIVEKLTAKAIGYIVAALAAVAIIGTAAYLVNRWDDDRLQARYDAGVTDERDRWTTAQADAQRAQQGRQDAGTLASEGAADASRQAAAGVRLAASSDTETTVKEITHAFQQAPPATTCVAPGDSDRPRALPVGVLDALDQARGRAIGGAPAAPG